MSSRPYNLSYLHNLESEAIHVFREVAAEFERPVILYSVGKDSSVLLRLAQKAFHPGKIPMPLLHIDTGFKFAEMYEFRDRYVKQVGADLIVSRNKKGISENTNPYDLGTQKCCGILKTEGLLQALRKGNFQAAVGAARRDEEKSRAKERFFSFRDKHGQWDPKNQRPELWNTYNCLIKPEESLRVFPMSNWTELDIWHYIHVEKIPIVPLYFAQMREMIRRNDQIIPFVKGMPLKPGEKPISLMSRFRTLGCYPCTGAVESQATTVEEIIFEILSVRTSERATRVIDHDVEGSMEIKKREGYF